MCPWALNRAGSLKIVQPRYSRLFPEQHLAYSLIWASLQLDSSDAQSGHPENWEYAQGSRPGQFN